jgi:hypothetical protein
MREACLLADSLLRVPSVEWNPQLRSTHKGDPKSFIGRTTLLRHSEINALRTPNYGGNLSLRRHFREKTAAVSTKNPVLSVFDVGGVQRPGWRRPRHQKVDRRNASSDVVYAVIVHFVFL